ncbi:flagellar hook-basal body complex protein [Marinobacterium arenosum]|uniref:flagellar hook-basal body complex protein n=1 Tax=Marinobacterium arenosum TaxID=2862496 RepID=UPI001C96EBA0|nr:flagellar hook-basal body complex protein [Marinobacterium arenosum]MBY4675921.1 flagellar hook-basal body complex protein [Marinobacterium arenosum]
MAGFNTAVTGIKSATTELDVVGNNIANSSTVGFKASRTEFGDIYSNAVVGAGSSNVAGSGVTVTDIAQDFKSGTIEFTNSNLDLAINGSGFFQLSDGQGGVTYTRAGSFELDKDGFIVSKNGKYLQGYGLDAQGNQLPLRNMAVDQKESPPHATENIALSFNIDSAADSSLLAPIYDKNNASSFTWSTTVETFDSLGNSHNIKFNFAEQRPVREVYEYTVMENDDATAGDGNGDGTFPATISGIAIADLAAQLTADNHIDWGANATYTQYRLDLEQQDPRIDVDSMTFDPATGTLSFELKADSSATGDVRVVGLEDTDADGIGDLATQAVLVPNNLTIDGYPATRDANEVQSYTLDAANAAIFDAANGTLLAATDLDIGGYLIPLDTSMTADDIGQLIADSAESIKELNPDIKAVQYDSSTNTFDIIWEEESGDVGILPVSGGATSPFTTADNTPASNVKGDNSFMGVYRMYGYLNDDQQLNLGKRVDPGEAGFAAQNTEVGPVVIRFNPTTGVLSEVNGETLIAGGAVPKLTILGADPANPTDTILESDIDNLKGIQLDIAGSTQYRDANIVKPGGSQDGYTKGDLIGVSFAETGEMVASFSNGQLMNLGLVAVATFENQSGLQPAGDTEWVATLESGQASLNPPGTGLSGTLRSAALEQSNVDLSEELVKLIEAQRNYQANSKTLETLNTVTQSILQI